MTFEDQPRFPKGNVFAHFEEHGRLRTRVQQTVVPSATQVNTRITTYYREADGLLWRTDEIWIGNHMIRFDLQEDGSK